MLVSNSGKAFKNLLKIIFSIILFEYLLFIFSGVNMASLTGDHFFSIGADPAFWIVFGLKIPQFFAAQHFAGLIMDFSIVALLLLFIHNPFNYKCAIALFMLLFLYYISLMGYLTHRNYQCGFFLAFLPFIFKKNISRYYAFEATRYFMLLFYVTAALLKISGHSLSGHAHFSHLLAGQFTPYFLEHNTGFRTDLNIYLVNNTLIATLLYYCAFTIESLMIIGFFTKKFDLWLAMLLLLFHFGTWLIMDIAPFGQIGFICLLFISKKIKIHWPDESAQQAK